MALVDGDGWISDESSFYGDDTTKAEWENEAQRQLEVPPTNFYTRLLTRKFEFDLSQLDAKPARALEQQRRNSDAQRPVRKKLKVAETSDKEPPAEVKGPPPARRSEDEAADFEDWLARSEGNLSVHQPNETIEEFLQRAPVLAAETAQLGPWLWVANLNVQSTKAKVEAFVNQGTQLLEAFKLQKTQVEQQNPEKTPYTITRALKPHREKLEDEILAAAVETNTTCGKWMLFPSSKALPEVWRLVAESTADGTLGPCSKVATPNPHSSKDETLICVYTHDFRDEHDVRRVLDRLLEIGAAVRDRPIYYKCDAYTYLGITSDNLYRIRASLYSSKEMLASGQQSKTQDGPLGRMKQRTTRIDSVHTRPSRKRA